MKFRVLQPFPRCVTPATDPTAGFSEIGVSRTKACRWLWVARAWRLQFTLIDEAGTHTADVAGVCNAVNEYDLIKGESLVLFGSIGGFPEYVNSGVFVGPNVQAGSDGLFHPQLGLGMVTANVGLAKGGNYGTGDIFNARQIGNLTVDGIDVPFYATTTAEFSAFATFEGTLEITRFWKFEDADGSDAWWNEETGAPIGSNPLALQLA